MTTLLGLDGLLFLVLAVLAVIVGLLAVRLSHANAQVAVSTATLQERNHDVEEQLKTRNTLEKTIVDQTHDLTQHLTTIAGLEERIRSLGETIARLTTERDASHQKRDEADAKYTSLQSDYAGLKASLSALQTTIAEDEQRIANLKAQMAEIFEEKARTVIENHAGQFAKSVDEKQMAIDNLLKPVQEHLTTLQGKVEELEKVRAAATTELKTTIDALMKRTDTLQTATTTLSTSLTGSSQARGRWGEIHLNNLLERAGMSAYCDLDTQEAFRDLEGGGRPDVLIRIPNANLRIPVDAKAPDVDYRAYLNATEDVDRRAALARHVRAMDGHARALANRNYSRFEGIAPMTIMYVPNEGMLAATFAEDPDIWERCATRGIYLASPLTLLLQLRAYAAGWQVVAQEENAKHIAEEATELYHRLATFTHAFSGVGRGLASATTAFNRAASSYQGRLMPKARRMRELGLPITSEDAERAEELVDELDIVAREVVAGAPADDEPEQPSLLGSDDV